MGGGDLKLLSASYFPLSSSTNSRRTIGSVSSLAPLNLKKVKCDWIETNGSKDERNTSGECNGDVKPQRGEGLTGNNIDLFRLSCLFNMPSPMQFSPVQFSK